MMDEVIEAALFDAVYQLLKKALMAVIMFFQHASRGLLAFGTATMNVPAILEAAKNVWRRSTSLIGPPTVSLSVRSLTMDTIPVAQLATVIEEHRGVI